jgi:hypothetical protein
MKAKEFEQQQQVQQEKVHLGTAHKFSSWLLIALYDKNGMGSGERESVRGI